ncbi:transcriptional regulator [Catellatospora sichuanensis]|uniref:transcriptional regulator n=1 Tax=Catellatospora sichuanensis TaxID=1969805 RepID=UPI001182B88C|nr:transcriptional regulator [Catellatospora sichuanensis]
MHPLAIRRQARLEHRNGSSIGSVAARLGLPYQTVRTWCRNEGAPDSRFTEARCFRCRETTSADREPYAYLLGIYLGDGHLVTSAKVPVLRISCTAAYTDLLDQAEKAMLATLANRVQRIRQKGSVNLQSYSKHWPCLFPQAGAGKKHERRIELESWQQAIVLDHPGAFLRGLFHSDGCRAINRITKNGKTYEYPRYLFANESADILAVCGWALDLLGVAWRLNRRNSLSVARRDAVALLDEHVGPKS